MIKRILTLIKNLLNRVFKSRAVHAVDGVEYDFGNIQTTQITPDLKEVKEGNFVHVKYKDVSYWVLFRCPCGCYEVISLPLKKSEYSSAWRLTIEESGRPTLFPSIWQNTGCYSHFWITDGKTRWCNNTGIAPWIAAPNKYERGQ